MIEPLRKMFDILFPRTCHVCGKVLDGDQLYLCQSCRIRLPRTNYHRVADNAMERRFMGKFPFEHATGYFFYSRDSDIANLIHDFKYRRFPGLARELGRLVGTELALTSFLNGIDVVVAVPLHWRKQVRRGYNQTSYLARGIAEGAGLSVSNDLVARRHHRTQTSLTPEERYLNTRGIFRLLNPERYSGKGVLLVDDVCTTGATLTSAAETIVTAVPDARISLLTLGVTF